MKTVNAFIAFCMLLIVSCSSPNPVEYNNKLMTVMNDNEKDMIAMNTAMNSQDYKKAEEVRKTWQGKLNKAIGEVEKLGQLKDDEGLKAAVAEGLKGYKQIAEADYKNLIELRTKEKEGDTTVQAGIQKILDKMNTDFEKIGNKINQCAMAFEKKYSGK